MSNQNNVKDVVISRTINSPIQKVWDMWVIPENFQKWYGPEGASIPVADMDVRVGGKRFIAMEMDTPNGPMMMWFTGEYLEVSPVTKLSYTEVIADKDGNMIPPSAMGMPGDEPDITTVTVELTDMGDTTKMVMTHAGVPAGSPGETGWNMALNKLEKALS